MSLLTLLLTLKGDNMKKVIPVFSLIIFLFLSNIYLIAQEKEEDIKAKYLNTVSLAYNGYWFSYKETEGSKVLDKDTGWINGGFIEYRGDTDFLFFRINVDISGSNSAKYEGSLQDGYGNTTPYSTTTKEMFFQQEINGGFKLLKLNDFIISPYAALGYRDWLRGENKGYDYEEEYTWLYIGIGFNLVYYISNWKFGLEALFEYPVDPEMRTNLAGQVDDATFKLKPKPAYYINATINYTFYKKNFKSIFVFISPYYQRWNIGASDTVTLTQNGTPVAYAYEPSSHTDIFGGRLGIGMSF